MRQIFLGLFFPKSFLLDVPDLKTKRQKNLSLKGMFPLRGELN